MKATIQMRADDAYSAQREDKSHFIFEAPDAELQLGVEIEGDLDAPEGSIKLTSEKNKTEFSAVVRNNRCDVAVAPLLLRQLRPSSEVEMVNSKGETKIM